MESGTLPRLLLSVILCIGCGTTAMNMALETNEVSDHFLTTGFINTILDILLKHYTKKLEEEEKTEVEIGSFERRFSTKVLTMDIEGAFEVQDGMCGNISTLHRTGDAHMKREGNHRVLTAHLGLSDLKIDFKSYDISLLGVHQNGKVHVKIGQNSLWLKVSVQLEPTCEVWLSDLKIETLDNFDIDITNLGIFENLTDEITSWIIDEVSKKFRHSIEQDVFQQLANMVKQADICHYLPH